MKNAPGGNEVLDRDIDRITHESRERLPPPLHRTSLFDLRPDAGESGDSAGVVGGDEEIRIGKR